MSYSEVKIGKDCALEKVTWRAESWLITLSEVIPSLLSLQLREGTPLPFFPIPYLEWRKIITPFSHHS
ncbi:MAG: hypothetical protein KDD67_18710 [Ignavibacteriae bacterium]|nr:hypothetical protein [Ignavibacteriota bacterium]